MQAVLHVNRCNKLKNWRNILPRREFLGLKGRVIARSRKSATIVAYAEATPVRARNFI